MFSLLRPIAFTVIAIGLFFTFIEPTFNEVRAIEDETNDYREAVVKASEFNRLSSALVDRKNSFTRAELERLEALAPDNVDEISVMADLQGVVLQNNMVLSGIEAGEWVAQAAGENGETLDDLEFGAAAEFDPTAGPEFGAGFATEPEKADLYESKDFTLSVLGTYDQFKDLLSDIERSLLLMQLAEISFEGSEGQLGTYTIVVRVSKLKSE